MAGVMLFDMGGAQMDERPEELQSYFKGHSLYICYLILPSINLNIAIQL